MIRVNNMCLLLGSALVGLGLTACNDETTPSDDVSASETGDGDGDGDGDGGDGDEEGEGGNEAGDSGETGGTGEDAGADEADSGCACSSAPNRSGYAVFGLALALLLGVRRRSR